MIRLVRSAAVAGALTLALASPALAVTVYSGIDGAAAGAASAFDAAVGVFTLETFDARADGELSPSWTYAGGTATLSNGNGVTSAFAYGGGPVSGAKGYQAYPDLGGGDPLFSFTSPIRAFGAFFVDMEVGNTVYVTRANGQTETFAVPFNAQMGGAVSFFGLDYGSGPGITAITFDVANDEALLIDDVRISTAAVPEPGSWALMIVGFGVGGAMLRRRAPLRA